MKKAGAKAEVIATQNDMQSDQTNNVSLAAQQLLQFMPKRKQQERNDRTHMQDNRGAERWR